MQALPADRPKLPPRRKSASSISVIAKLQVGLRHKQLAPQFDKTMMVFYYNTWQRRMIALKTQAEKLEALEQVRCLALLLLFLLLSLLLWQGMTSEN